MSLPQQKALGAVVQEASWLSAVLEVGISARFFLLCELFWLPLPVTNPVSEGVWDAVNLRSEGTGVSRPVQHWEEWLVCQVVVLPFRGTFRMEKWVNECKATHLDRINLGTRTGWVLTGLKQPCREGLEALVDTKLGISQQCARRTKKTKGILCFMRELCQEVKRAETRRPPELPPSPNHSPILQCSLFIRWNLLSAG